MPKLSFFCLQLSSLYSQYFLLVILLISLTLVILVLSQSGFRLT